jgi:hypothetical protein
MTENRTTIHETKTPRNRASSMRIIQPVENASTVVDSMEEFLSKSHRSKKASPMKARFSSENAKAITP